MPGRHRIDSPRNPRVKALLRLRTRRERDREGRFLIEGERELRRAAEAGVTLATLCLCPELLRPDGRALAERLEPTAGEVLELSEAAFRKLSYRDAPDGLLAAAPSWRRPLDGLELPPAPLLLVIDGLEKPGNLGALLRTADGAGLDAVVVTGEGTDLFNPNVVRASMGSLFALPVLTVDADALRVFLETRGIPLVATSPAAERSYWEVDYTGGAALVLGAEHSGLDPAWLSGAALSVRIPMRGLADSLNVATAGALVIYEALRQRQSRA